MVQYSIVGIKLLILFLIVILLLLLLLLSDTQKHILFHFSIVNIVWPLLKTMCFRGSQMWFWCIWVTCSKSNGTL